MTGDSQKRDTDQSKIFGLYLVLKAYGQKKVSWYVPSFSPARGLFCGISVPECPAWSDVEAEVHNVAVPDDVVFAFHVELTRLFYRKL